MSTATDVARFAPQLTLGLGTGTPASPPPPAVPPQPPTLAELVAAARANRCVQAFLAEGILTWTAERVERNPPCYLVYEHGEVVGNVSDLAAMARFAEKRRGLGRRLGVRALYPDDEVLPYTLGLRWGPTHPRRLRWERRMALKRLLPRGDRRAVRRAMQKNQRDFLAWAAGQSGLGFRVADATGLSLAEFWREVRGRCRTDPGSPPGAHPSEKKTPRTQLTPSRSRPR